MGILHPFLGDHPQRVKRGVLTTIAGELRPMMFWGRQWGKEVFGVGAGTGQWLVSVNSLSSVMRFSAQTCIYETRVKAPRAWRPPEGNQRPGCAHVSTPGSDDSPIPRPCGRPSGGPQLLFPCALLGQFFTHRARWCPEAIGQMRCAGLRDTPVSWLPFRHFVFSALICWEATGYEGRGATVGTAPQHHRAQQHAAGSRDLL